MRKTKKPTVAIIMGSQSDWATMKHAAETLDGLLALALAKELSGEAAVDRVQQHSTACLAVKSGEASRPLKVDLLAGKVTREPLPRGEAYAQAAEERFNGVNRCC